ncbi:MAG TPA: membrane dipeptidase [Limnochorda sp.]
MIRLSEEQRERALRLHQESFVFDYIPPGEPIVMTPATERVMQEALRAGEPAPAVQDRMREARLEELARDPAVREMMREVWRRSGVNCVSATLGGLDHRLDPLERLWRDLGRWQRRFQVADDMVLCTTAGKVEEAWRAGRVGVILNLQNTDVIGQDLDRIRTLYNYGVRIIQLTYNTRNLVGDGCTERNPSGLSLFGVSVVRELNRQGIVVDLSHCSEPTAWDAIELSESPPCFTHAFCKALSDHDRGKTDEQLKAVAERGGYLGILAVPFFLSRDPAAGLEALLDHINHAVEIMGVDKVGIGTDWGGWTRDVPEPLREGLRRAFYAMGFRDEHGLQFGAALGEFVDYTDWPHITCGLVARGYSDDEIRGILGRNFLNYFRRVVGA